VNGKVRPEETEATGSGIGSPLFAHGLHRHVTPSRMLLGATPHCVLPGTVHHSYSRNGSEEPLDASHCSPTIMKGFES